MKVIRIFFTGLAIIVLVQFALSQTTTLESLAQIKDGYRSKRVSSYDRTGGNKDFLSGIKPGETAVLFDVKGAGIISHIWITIAPMPEKLSRNDIILKMYWDGNSFPSVNSPIGPFFGQGWQESYPFNSLPLVVGPVEGRALVSYFNMPFTNGAKIEIVNETSQTIDNFYYSIDYVALEKLPDNLGRFHAWYNNELTGTLEEGENEWSVLNEPGKNINGDGNYLIAKIKGKGHFVGVNYYVHSPTPIWYGEGDEMICIDGEKLPSIVGTGTEDYFNTSWCPKTLFQHPFFGYARVNNDIGWLGRTHLYRFQISDPIYFNESLTFTIEHGHNNCLTLDLASVAYWYQAPPLYELPPSPDKLERQPKKMIDYIDIHKWRHAWRSDRTDNLHLWGNEPK